MLSTRVGYAGGSSPNPTYHNIADHSESVEILYDPQLVSYEQLLELFWESHDPRQPSYSRQYVSIIFTHDDEQRRLAEQSKSRQESEGRGTVRTEILPAGEFTQAEAYHQKYYLRSAGALLRELAELLPGNEALVRSTLAARLNAMTAGYLSLEELQRELPIFGLEPAQETLLLEALRRRFP